MRDECEDNICTFNGSKAKMKFELMVASLLNWFRFMSLQETEPSKCVIVQKKMSIFSFPTPSFLLNYNRAECQVRGAGEGMLRCGKSDVYIKPKCVCSFHHVYEASKYHDYSFCPQGEESDDVTLLKCPDCEMYSLNNNGPCINGGRPSCKTNEVAPKMTCECPSNYGGMFCEEKMENVTRLCDRISNSSAKTLPNCDNTKQKCVTYSSNRRYAFQCDESDTYQERGELPICNDTEVITVSPAANDVPYSIDLEDEKTSQAKSRNVNSAAEIHSSIPLLTVINVTIVRYFYNWMT